MTAERRKTQAGRLRAERERRGWGQRRMARHLRDAINDQQKPELSSFVTYVKRWESGKAVVSDPRYRAAYAAVLGVPEDELFDDAITVPTGSLDCGVIPEDAGDDVRRRAALQLLAALGAGATIPPGAIEEILAGIENALGNPIDLDEWDRTVHEYGQLLMVRPAGSLIQDLTADIVAVGALLKRDLADTQRQRMLRVSAGLSACLAIDLGDAGQMRAARATWSTAKRAADASGDADLRVWVRGRAAQDACWMGRPEGFVADLADEAIAIAGDRPSVGLARAQAARAYVAAGQGDVSQAHASLAGLQQTFERLPDVADQTVMAFRESQLRWSEAYVRVLVGDGRARETVAHAQTLYPAGAHKPLTNLALMDAAALVRARDVEAGLQKALTTVESHPDATSAGRAALTGQILRALPPKARQSPAARELRALTSVRGAL